MESDKLFKSFIGEDDLATSSDGDIVDIKHIGKFKVTSHNSTKWIELKTVIGKTTVLFLSSYNGGRLGLMKFLRLIFKRQSKLSEDGKNTVLSTMSESRDNIKGSVKFSQYIAKQATINNE